MIFAYLSVIARHLHARRVQRDTERQVTASTDRPLVVKIINPWGADQTPSPQELNGD